MTVASVLIENLAVHLEPSSSSKVVDYLYLGQTATVLGRSSDGYWLEVELGPKSGWISASYVHLDQETQ